ncbi:MAG: Adenylate kinase [Candidatus Collierbacteria bacterium GW2011_GWB1_44_6]|uniref:Adenylate kinase n=2 Tax=Candidatus Collieribacteriota TaxID=1752725 RepID=A0A0G1LXJ1_9BACT|nr:MAG: Adenylate kinase [Candidatus Collierbacteria bacterium GW2011_GWC2_43_12]KKT73542.1 MAG: Adenylate kinase [Candidatus Collierbacteria bacterium GW2011_GWB1_44_6]KKT82807.1 MAG: adenylate kinase, adenylate kinase [Microgenomates group bacterium GW2011_GWC1_44_9]
MLKNEIITFIGPEGSGKTTLSKKLEGVIDLPCITTGDILRDLAMNDPGQLGEECRAMFATSIYLPGEKFLEVLASRLIKPDLAHGLILDGGLRTLEETKGFHEMLQRVKRVMPMTIFHLVMPDSMSFERLVTGEKARKRDFDTLEGVAGRLAEFHNQLEERLETIRRQEGWRLIEIDATLTLEKVFENVLAEFGLG